MAAAPAAAGVAADLARYYARRAAEYDRIYAKPERQADLRLLEAALPKLFVGRHVLEVACGTGWWTPHGARDAQGWLATDLQPETLAIARTRALPGCVRFAVADAHALHTVPGPFDAAFAGHWWSHVPLTELPAWLGALHTRLGVGARVVFLDNQWVPGSSTPIARCDEAGNTWQRRRLDDGSVHEVLKNFPAAAQAQAALQAAPGPRPYDVQWQALKHYWLLSYALR
jgi:SAM-dependent methyltransferase